MNKAIYSAAVALAALSLLAGCSRDKKGSAAAPAAPQDMSFEAAAKAMSPSYDADDANNEDLQANIAKLELSSIGSIATRDNVDEYHVILGVYLKRNSHEPISIGLTLSQASEEVRSLAPVETVETVGRFSLSARGKCLNSDCKSVIIIVTNTFSGGEVIAKFDLEETTGNYTFSRYHYNELTAKEREVLSKGWQGTTTRPAVLVPVEEKKEKKKEEKKEDEKGEKTQGEGNNDSSAGAAAAAANEKQPAAAADVGAAAVEQK